LRFSVDPEIKGSGHRLIVFDRRGDNSQVLKWNLLLQDLNAMNNLRKYGKPPFEVAVIHGGPGAPGEMAAVARELCRDMGVLEPLQTAKSAAEQIEELKSVLESAGSPPLILIGHSWGAWLAYLLAARHPELVKKLILVSSGPFEASYGAKILETRLSRMNAEEIEEAQDIFAALKTQGLDQKRFARMGELMSHADAFDPLTDDSELLETRPDIYQPVWEQASELRRGGELLRMAENIRCPVVAIHGDYDPHPAEGIRVPLSRVIKDFRFILLEHCGHNPWLERQAKKRFYDVLRRELKG
jgi:pimeloyl-ACP methyl ester carboxylesterase